MHVHAWFSDRFVLELSSSFERIAAGGTPASPTASDQPLGLSFCQTCLSYLPKTVRLAAVR